MAHIDNEYHRLASDVEPTLNELRPTLNAPADTPQKRSRRVKAWAMKLLAGVLAAAAVFTVVANRVSSWQGLPDWPRLEASSSEYLLSSSALSKQGSFVQFAMGSKTYRLTASGSDLCFMWHGSYGYPYDGAFNSASFQVASRTDGWVFTLILSNHDDEKKSPDNAYGTISTSDGQVFYMEAISHLDSNDQAINTSQELQSFIAQFLTHSRIVLGTDSGWGKILVGQTMYSDLYHNWCGFRYYNGDTWELAVNYAREHDLKPEEIVGERTINDIHWTFYFKLSTVSNNTDMMLWAVPEQESDIAFGVTQSELTNAQYSYTPPQPRGGVEEDEDWVPVMLTGEQMMQIVAQQLSCYHLLTDGNYK